jgi:DNA-binding NtrC family response regulator
MPSFRDLEGLLTRRKTPNSSTTRHPIVVIEDDAASRRGLELLLGDQYQVTLCDSAREGVAAVNEDTCAVILDVKMPGEDGFWACTEIRNKTPDLPVIFYSAHQNLKDPYSIINELRPFGYFSKGEDIQSFLNSLALAVRLQAIIISNRKLIRTLEQTKTQTR